MSGLRYFVVFRAASEQLALEESEALAGRLRREVAAHRLGGFDVPSAILPSERAQKERQAAIPDEATLRARFDRALAGLPFRAGAFAPFFHDAASVRTAPFLTPARLPPALALQLDSMLVRRDGGWTVIAPLRGVSDPASIAAAVGAAGPPGAAFVDLQHESDRLLQSVSA